MAEIELQSPRLSRQDATRSSSSGVVRHDEVVYKDSMNGCVRAGAASDAAVTVIS